MKIRTLSVVLFLFILVGCTGTSKVLPIQFKDLNVDLQKRQIKEINYSPDDNGTLSIALNDDNQYVIAFNNYNMELELAARLDIKTASNYELFDALFNENLPTDKKLMIDQLYASANVEKLLDLKEGEQKIYLIELLDNSFELFINTLADDSGYYAIKGFASESDAKLFATNTQIVQQ